MNSQCIPFGVTSDDLTYLLEDGACQDGLASNSIKISRSGDASYSSRFGFTYTITCIGPNV